MHNPLLISIIIISSQHREILLEEIYALLNQSIDKSLYEILIVDISLSSETNEYLSSNGVMNKIKYISQKGLSHAAAKNIAVNNSQGGILIFLAEDMIPANRFAESHLKYQKIYDGQILLGFSKWEKPEKSQLPLKLINPFNYEKIEDEDNVEYYFFNTLNMSVKKEVLMSAGVFDEKFRSSKWSDIEMGYRLVGVGNVKMQFLPQAYTEYKCKAMDFKSVLQREYIFGSDAAYLQKKYPTGDFSSTLPSKKNILLYSLPSLRKNIDEMMLKILDNTIPLQKAMRHFFKSAAYCSFSIGYKTGRK